MSGAKVRRVLPGFGLSMGVTISYLSLIVLILMILAEGTGAPAIYLHISGALLLIGRMAHPFGLGAIDHAAMPMRYVGNATNILATVIAMVCIAVNLAGL